VQMAVLNLTKEPRTQVPFGGYGALSFTPEGGLKVAAPLPQPLFSRTGERLVPGVLLPLASGRF
jgi:hypothetical protein